jgi:succinate dehydrogenase (ubiquinone) cytochrome b560 subunit
MLAPRRPQVLFRAPTCLRSGQNAPILGSMRFLSRASTNTANTRLQVDSLTAAQHANHLAAQRIQRPISPHLSIYQPQITWYSGALMRNCAIIITVPVYLFGAAYLVSPLFGWQLDTASMVEWFGSLPLWTRLAVKGLVGFPFCFHLVHGTRHLIWDTGAMLSNRQVTVSGWIGLGVSIIATVGLFLW